MGTKRRPLPGETEDTEITKELSAQPVDPAEPNGAMVANEAKIREAGAIDTESIRANRRNQAVVNRKAGGEKEARFNEPNIFIKYEEVSKIWPINTLVILVKRLTGTPAEFTITSQPKTASELYDEIKKIHGKREEATYDITFRDSFRKEHRGTGRVDMPNTIEIPPSPPPPQGQQPYPYYPQQPPPSAPANPPQAGGGGMDLNAILALQKQQFEMWQAAQQAVQRSNAPAPAVQAAAPPAQAAPAQAMPPGVGVPPPGLDLAGLMEWQRQQWSLWQTAQGASPAAVAPAAAPGPGMDLNSILALQRQQFEMWQATQQAAQHPPIAPAVAPNPPPGPPVGPGMDLNSILALQRQQFEMWQAAQQAAQRAQQPQPQPPSQPQPQPPQPQPQPQPQLSGMPPVQAPPGMFFVPGFGFVPAEKLFAALSGSSPGSGEGGPYRGPYRGPYSGGSPGGGPYGGGPYRPPYGPQYGPQGGDHPYPGQPPYGAPPARQKTAAEEFRDAVSFVRSAVQLASELAPQQPAPATAPEPEDDDSPVKVIDAGPAKLVINSKDGSARYWETGWANMDKIFKWVGEQREAIQKANAERERPQRQPLPPGYVEMTPDYKPPPGYVAVPVQQIPQELPSPPPPDQMPPPISSPPPPSNEPARPPWGMPPVPGGG